MASAGTADGGYVVTEAGFGADMGLERFVDLKCAVSGLKPAAAVVVVTVRALKAHSGRFQVVGGKELPARMLEEDLDAVTIFFTIYAYFFFIYCNKYIILTIFCI